ncbi:MAG TPA: UDP-glucose 4-epimerase GalE [Pyrinomonadaceae bacterium]|jgi:UDP-glucose 4-epimerase|nr:UDP-glucose 4-epimerase GalE [Pyrinomonadaceae bacterium]
MRVLVTGGAGYIGSVVAEELVRDGHETVVYDSLYKGHRGAVVRGAEFVEGDLANSELLGATFRERGTEAVIHMAADSLVGESATNPAKYYRNNVAAGLSLLEAMNETGVRRLVFSSTAAVYGEPEKQPIEESDPTRPTNPYGETKLAFERALQWYEQAYLIRYASLRYFNAAGATRACGEDHDPETHLIPIVLQAAVGLRTHVEVYGTDYPTRDGTCVRDYIHVVDLASAHVLALSILDERSAIYNLGCGGDGYTVNEVVETARVVTGRDIRLRTGARRAGDPAVLVASSEKIRRELGWSPRRQDLSEIVSSAWEWMLAHPDGYEDEGGKRRGQRQG